MSITAKFELNPLSVLSIITSKYQKLNGRTDGRMVGGGLSYVPFVAMGGNYPIIQSNWLDDKYTISEGR